MWCAFLLCSLPTGYRLFAASRGALHTFASAPGSYLWGLTGFFAVCTGLGWVIPLGGFFWP